MGEFVLPHLNRVAVDLRALADLGVDGRGDRTEALGDALGPLIVGLDDLFGMRLEGAGRRNESLDAAGDRLGVGQFLALDELLRALENLGGLTGAGEGEIPLRRFRRRRIAPAGRAREVECRARFEQVDRLLKGVVACGCEDDVLIAA